MVKRKRVGGVPSNNHPSRKKEPDPPKGPTPPAAKSKPPPEDPPSRRITRSFLKNPVITEKSNKQPSTSETIETISNVAKEGEKSSNNDGRKRKNDSKVKTYDPQSKRAKLNLYTNSNMDSDTGLTLQMSKTPKEASGPRGRKRMAKDAAKPKKAAQKSALSRTRVKIPKTSYKLETPSPEKDPNDESHYDSDTTVVLKPDRLDTSTAPLICPPPLKSRSPAALKQADHDESICQLKSEPETPSPEKDPNDESHYDSDTTVVLKPDRLDSSTAPLMCPPPLKPRSPAVVKRADHRGSKGHLNSEQVSPVVPKPPPLYSKPKVSNNPSPVRQIEVVTSAVSTPPTVHELKKPATPMQPKSAKCSEVVHPTSKTSNDEPSLPISIPLVHLKLSREQTSISKGKDSSPDTDKRTGLIAAMEKLKNLDDIKISKFTVRGDEKNDSSKHNDEDTRLNKHISQEETCPFDSPLNFKPGKITTQMIKTGENPKSDSRMTSSNNTPSNSQGARPPKQILGRPNLTYLNIVTGEFTMPMPKAGENPTSDSKMTSSNNTPSHSQGANTEPVSSTPVKIPAQKSPPSTIALALNTKLAFLRQRKHIHRSKLPNIKQQHDKSSNAEKIKKHFEFPEASKETIEMQKISEMHLKFFTKFSNSVIIIPTTEHGLQLTRLNIRQGYKIDIKDILSPNYYEDADDEDDYILSLYMKEMENKNDSMMTMPKGKEFGLEVNTTTPSLAIVTLSESSKNVSDVDDSNINQSTPEENPGGEKEQIEEDGEEEDGKEQGEEEEEVGAHEEEEEVGLEVDTRTPSLPSDPLPESPKTVLEVPGEEDGSNINRRSGGEEEVSITNPSIILPPLIKSSMKVDDVIEHPGQNDDSNIIQSSKEGGEGLKVNTTTPTLPLAPLTKTPTNGTHVPGEDEDFNVIHTSEEGGGLEDNITTTPIIVPLPESPRTELEIPGQDELESINQSSEKKGEQVVNEVNTTTPQLELAPLSQSPKVVLQIPSQNDDSLNLNNPRSEEEEEVNTTTSSLARVPLPKSTKNVVDVIEIPGQDDDSNVNQSSEEEGEQVGLEVNSTTPSLVRVPLPESRKKGREVSYQDDDSDSSYKNELGESEIESGDDEQIKRKQKRRLKLKKKFNNDKRKNWPTILGRISFPFINIDEENVHLTDLVAKMVPGENLDKFADIPQKIAAINYDFVDNGYQKYDLTGFKSPSNMDHLYMLKNNERFNKYVIRFNLNEIYKLSKDIYYVKTYEFSQAEKRFPELGFFTVGDIVKYYECLFNCKGGDNTALFFTILDSLTIDDDCKGSGLLIPFITVYDDVDVDQDVKRTGVDWDAFKNPLRIITPNRGGHFQTLPGITFPTTDISFAGGITTSQIGKGPALNSIQLLTFGEAQNWIVVPPRWYKKTFDILKTKLDEIVPSFQRHKLKCLFQHDNLLIAPSFYDNNNIPYSIVNQSEGEVMVFATNSIVCSISNGLNISKSLAACLSDFHYSVSHGIQQCRCNEDEENTSFNLEKEKKTDMSQVDKIMRHMTNKDYHWLIAGKDSAKRVKIYECLVDLVEKGGTLANKRQVVKQRQQQQIPKATSKNQTSEIVTYERPSEPNDLGNEPGPVKHNKNYSYKPPRYFTTNAETERLYDLSQVLLGNPDIEESFETRSKKQERNFSCPTCKRFFTNMQKYQDHIDGDMCGDWVTCFFTNCTTKTDSEDKWNAHYRSHIAKTNKRLARQLYEDYYADKAVAERRAKIAANKKRIQEAKKAREEEKERLKSEAIAKAEKKAEDKKFKKQVDKVRQAEEKKRKRLDKKMQKEHKMQSSLKSKNKRASTPDSSD